MSPTYWCSQLHGLVFKVKSINALDILLFYLVHALRMWILWQLPVLLFHNHAFSHPSNEATPRLVPSLFLLDLKSFLAPWNTPFFPFLSQDPQCSPLFSFLNWGKNNFNGSCSIYWPITGVSIHFCPQVLLSCLHSRHNAGHNCHNA